MTQKLSDEDINSEETVPTPPYLATAEAFHHLSPQSRAISQISLRHNLALYLALHLSVYLAPISPNISPRTASSQYCLYHHTVAQE